MSPECGDFSYESYIDCICLTYFAFYKTTWGSPEDLMDPVCFGEHCTEGKRKPCGKQKGSDL